MKKWVWEESKWPHFQYDPKQLASLEHDFLQNSGFLLGAFKHLSDVDSNQLKIEITAEEAVETSAIEGEILNRNSVRASLRRNFGLISENVKTPPSENGIAYIMTDLYNNFATPLSHELLSDWHLQLTSHRFDLNTIGSYRTHDEPMQIVSGGGNRTRVHYEAPPSNILLSEMDQYLTWFNTHSDLSIVIKAGLAHVYFELIHPFEDGNGRIGRAIAEKAISQHFNQPLLLSISRIIQRNKNEYYSALAACNNNLEITNWLIYFAKTLLAAQAYTKDYIEFIIAKTKLYDRVRGQLNARQEKVINRIFKQGLDGFEGGLSAENYISITQTSRSTATRDLQDLVNRNIMYKTGELKSSRYYLLLD